MFIARTCSPHTHSHSHSHSYPPPATSSSATPPPATLTSISPPTNSQRSYLDKVGAKCVAKSAFISVTYDSPSLTINISNYKRAISPYWSYFVKLSCIYRVFLYLVTGLNNLSFLSTILYIRSIYLFTYLSVHLSFYVYGCSCLWVLYCILIIEVFKGILDMHIRQQVQNKAILH